MSGDLTKIAEEFEKLGRNESRKILEKKLQKTKMIYDRNRAELYQKQRLHDELGKQMEVHKEQMASAKDFMEKAYNVLKNMDLVGTDTVFWNDGVDVGYVKDKKLVRLLETGDFEPFRKRKKLNEDPSPEEEIMEIQKEVPDYEVCGLCGYDHSYEPVEAYLAHSEMAEE